MDWQPITSAQLDDILRQEIEALSPEDLTSFQVSAIPPAEQPCYRNDQYGIERVFVVVRAGARLLFFDDVEDEFAIGIPDSDGVLREWSLCGSLADTIRLATN
jgi:hypothetical protein